jgi:uncharacterized protein (TIGR02145 family)
MSGNLAGSVPDATALRRARGPTAKPIRIRVVTLALCIALAFVGSSCSAHSSPQGQTLSDTIRSSRRMPDGKQWMTENLNANIGGSYCYDDAELNCRRYGRLYTWESARRGCQSQGGGWRLPTNDEWRQLAKHYGGVVDDSDDGGKAAYAALSMGGSSGFNALPSGGRTSDGQYARLEAHGFYWTASESSPATAWLYNFGRARYLNRHSDGEKERAFAVRCVKE